MDPVQIWMNPQGIWIIPEPNMLISPIKACDTLPHPRVASMEPPQLETQFKKCVYAKYENNNINA
jgi:hypothetical protein